MNRLSTWLIAGSIAIALFTAIAFLVRPTDTAGDVQSVESALTAREAPAPETQPQPQPQPSASTVPESTPATTPLPTYPVQDTSLESLERTSAQPLWIRIDSIGVAAEVNPYGIDSRTGQMDVPDNVTEVGWYEFGPSPGEAGSAVLAAHVDLASQGPGVFFDLQSIDQGDVVVIGFDDGSTQRFAVEARTTYLKDELPLEAIFSRSGPSVLTLITCGGGFNDTAASYDSNVVAYAVPIDDPDTAS